VLVIGRNVDGSGWFVKNMSPIRSTPAALAALAVIALSVGGAVVTNASVARPSMAAAAPSRCHPKGTRLVLDRPHLTVFSYAVAEGPREYACPKAGGALLTIAESGGGYRDLPFAPPALRISGTSVGWALNARYETTGPDGGGRITLVRRARYFPRREGVHTRGWFSPTAIRAGYQPNVRVGSLVVRPSLSVAWIVCPPLHHGHETCREPGHRDTIYMAPHISSSRLKVATGSRIDPRSLRRHGDRIFWTEAGRRRSAPFPAS
jgi:hypothetical protein